jgi:hypothetical protein
MACTSKNELALNTLEVVVHRNLGQTVMHDGGMNVQRDHGLPGPREIRRVSLGARAMAL